MNVERRPMVENSTKMQSRRLLLGAPILPLPTELLRDIFCHVTSDTPSINAITPYGDFAPMNLAMVCKRWRDIALSMESLWSTISVDLKTLLHDGRHDELNPLKVQEVGCALQTYIRYSGNSPLSISIEARDHFSSTRLLRALTSQSHRWRSATLTVESEYFEPTEALGAIEGGFPCLEELTVKCEFFEEVTTFQHCPNLHSLTIADYSHWFLDHVMLPWNQLRVLTITDTLFSAEILPHCNHLVRLNIEGVSRDTGFCVESTDRQYSSDLQHLSLIILPQYGLNGTDEIANLFNALKLPFLKSVCVRVPIDSKNVLLLEEDFVAAISSCISRSGSTLETFSMQGIRIATESLRTTLTSMPTLTNLRLRVCTYSHPVEDENGTQIGSREREIISEELLHDLTYWSPRFPKGSNTPLLPRLQHIDLLLYPSMDEQVFLDMFESRWAPRTQFVGGSDSTVFRLEHMVLGTECHSELDPSSLSRLQRLETEGLKVTLDADVSHPVGVDLSEDGFDSDESF